MCRKLRVECLKDRRVMAADFNGDDTADALDLNLWKANFGKTVLAGQNGDANGDSVVDGNDFMQWQREYGAKRNQLIAYRPQGVYDPIEPPVDAPRYNPFPKRPVREADEMSNTLGPGIRINLDDDNLNGTPDAHEDGFEIPRENDLIEVKVQTILGNDMVLVPDFRLKLYYNHDKETPIPMIDGHTEDLEFEGGEQTVWVEWVAGQHGYANLSLVNGLTGETYDTVRFHSFRSMIIAFGGSGQNPDDTDGDGSIGDVTGPGNNREGIFDIAQAMYNTGWDVLAFDEEDLDAEGDVPFTEAVNAERQRFVEAHGFIGYSQGGGAVHDLIERLYSDEDIITRIGVYLDAVRFNGRFAETDWPDAVLHLLNIYSLAVEPIDLGGDAVDPSGVIPPATLEEYDVTNVAGGLDHFSIDDDPSVQATIRQRLIDLLIFR